MIEPKNEMGVVVRFSQICSEYGVEILSVQSAYPDAVIKLNGKNYIAEFEYYASNFLQHRHDPRHCDVVICWVNDLVGTDFPLPIWELSSPLTPTIQYVDEKEKELAYLRTENKYLRRKLSIEEEEKEIQTPNTDRIDAAVSALLKELRRRPSIREIQQFLRGQDSVDTGWSTSTISKALNRKE